MDIRIDLDAVGRHVVLLAGVGQDASSWDAAVSLLPDGVVPHPLAVSDLVSSDERFTMAAATSALDGIVDSLGIDGVVVVGLSMGAMLAMAYTIAHPDRVRGLVVSAPQVRPSPAIMLFEQAAVRLLPEGWLGLPADLGRARVLEILKVTSRIDFRRSLPDIQVPVLAICGSKDTANLAAARAVADGVPRGRLEIVEGGGHELNTERPADFARLVSGFVDEVS